MVGHKIDQNGIRPLQDKLKAIQELKEPKTRKKFEISPFWEQFNICQSTLKICRQRQTLLRQLLKKEKNWKWTTEHSEAFNQLKRKITEIPCLALYSSVRPNTITTDANTKVLGATLARTK